MCEVKYDHMQGARFRHAAIFLRWRSDRRPRDCGYGQLEVTPAYELANVFGAETSPRLSQAEREAEPDGAKSKSDRPRHTG